MKHFPPWELLLKTKETQAGAHLPGTHLLLLLIFIYFLKFQSKHTGKSIYAFNPSTQRQRADCYLWVWGQIGLQNKLQDSQGYIVKPHFFKVCFWILTVCIPYPDPPLQSRCHEVFFHLLISQVRAKASTLPPFEIGSHTVAQNYVVALFHPQQS